VQARSSTALLGLGMSEREPMRRRRCLTGVKKLLVPLAAGAAGLLSVAAPHPVDAGGWAVTTLDPMEMPAPGDQVDVGFTIRQHGVTPVAVSDVSILVTDASGATETFAAHPDGTTGHYVAPVTFPAAGSYRWSVVQGWFGPQDLGTVRVQPLAAPVDPGVGRWPLVWRVVLPLVAVVLVLAAFVDRRRVPAKA
jgi:hypothetical protein